MANNSLRFSDLIYKGKQEIKKQYKIMLKKSKIIKNKWSIIIYNGI